ncbi:MAG: methyltransferase domain-containing protein [Candidatus Competibacteraceae bacterium]|nr:methyltransferase domain-containing protein [Candidatus Competibacteraceae bacterium]
MKFLISIATRLIPRRYLHRVSHAVLRIVGLFYRGNVYEDPITGITYRKMLPYGRMHSRSNALAPDSMSLERHRLIWLYLRDRTDFFTSHYKVLHIAPEYCFIKRFRRMRNLHYTTGDLESPWADVKMDINAMPFADRTYDVVICNHVLEHIPDDVHAMREIYRVMKPGGWAILQVPMRYDMDITDEDISITDPSERERRFLQRDHFRLYGRDYADRLKQAGFEVEENKLVWELPVELVKRYVLPENEVLYIARRKKD